MDFELYNFWQRTERIEFSRTISQFRQRRSGGFTRPNRPNNSSDLSCSVQSSILLVVVVAFALGVLVKVGVLLRVVVEGLSAAGLVVLAVPAARAVVVVVRPVLVDGVLVALAVVALVRLAVAHPGS